MSSSPQTLERIKSLVESDRVVLFMKGDRNFPQCGFSATVVQILNNVVPEYKTVNVLSDPDIRQGVKDFASWPTIPQLYVDGEFVGGCDIIRDMFASGDLQRKLGVEAAAIEPPTITITGAAKAELTKALAEATEGDALHLAVAPNFEHSLGIGPKEPGEIEVEASGLTVLVDAASAARADGLTLDFQSGAEGSGFKIDNPNRPPEVVAISAADLKAKLASGEIEHLFDVRTPEERERASIEGATLLDDAAMKTIEGLDRETPIAFHCHHGMRSQQAAEHFRAKGFRKVYNLTGGIDAWSQTVDSSVPRY